MTFTLFGRDDGFEVNGKAVGEEKGLAGGEVGAMSLLVNGGLLGVGNGHENHVGAATASPVGEDFKAFDSATGMDLLPS